MGGGGSVTLGWSTALEGSLFFEEESDATAYTVTYSIGYLACLVSCLVGCLTWPLSPSMQLCTKEIKQQSKIRQMYMYTYKMHIHVSLRHL